MAQHLPGYARQRRSAALVGAACVAVLRLPLASVMIASLLCAKGRARRYPADLVVAVAVAFLTSETLTGYVDARVGAAPSSTLTGPELATRLRDDAGT